MTIAIRVQVVGWGDILILANFETMSRYISRYTEDYGMIYWNRLPSSYVLQCVSFDHAHTLHSAQCTCSMHPKSVTQPGGSCHSEMYQRVRFCVASYKICIWMIPQIMPTLARAAPTTQHQRPPRHIPIHSVHLPTRQTPVRSSSLDL